MRVTVAEPVDVLLNLARITPDDLVALVAMVRRNGVAVNRVPTIPTPGNDERGVRTVSVFVRSDTQQLSHLVDLIERGRLRINITERVPLPQLAALHAKAESGEILARPSCSRPPPDTLSAPQS